MKTSDGCGDSPKHGEIPFQAQLVDLCIPRGSKKASGSKNTFLLKGCKNCLSLILNKKSKNNVAKKSLRINMSFLLFLLNNSE